MSKKPTGFGKAYTPQQPEMPKDLRDQLDDAFSRESKAAGQRADASLAISAKRQADALERIADILAKQTGLVELLGDELRG